MLVELREVRDHRGLTVIATVEAQSSSELAACLERSVGHRLSSMLVLEEDYPLWVDRTMEDDLAGAAQLLRRGRILWDKPFSWSDRPAPRMFQCSLRVPDTALTQALCEDLRRRRCLKGVFVSLEHLALEHHNLELSSAAAAAVEQPAFDTGIDRTA